MKDEELQAAASKIVQFDVPESVTQNILKSVATEPTKQSFGLWIFLAAVAVSAFFLRETAESTSGMISWSIGLVVMYAVSLLISSFSEGETA